MLSSDRNINTIYNLITQLKKYVELRTENVQLGMVEFLTLLFSRVLLFLALLIPTLFILLFLTFIATALLARAFSDSWILASGVMVLFYFILGILIYINRYKWFIDPLADSIVRTLLPEKNLTSQNKDENNDGR